MWEDYDLENVSTWVPMQAPPLDREWVKALTKLGGLNPFKKPMLRCIWGASHKDPMSVDGGLKYWVANKERTLEGFDFKCPVTGLDMFVKKMDDVPPAVLVAIPRYAEACELGERRWIIEIWRSQEFLARSGRYQDDSVRDNGQSTDFVFCRACDQALAVDQEPNKPCPACGSFRTYIKTVREDGEGKLLHANPAEGCYDFFARLESVTGEPLDADAHALKLIEQLWQATKKTRKEKLTDMLTEVEGQAVTNLRATSPTNPFQSPVVPGW